MLKPTQTKGREKTYRTWYSGFRRVSENVGKGEEHRLRAYRRDSTKDSHRPKESRIDDQDCLYDNSHEGDTARVD